MMHYWKDRKRKKPKPYRTLTPDFFITWQIIYQSKLVICNFILGAVIAIGTTKNYCLRRQKTDLLAVLSWNFRDSFFSFPFHFLSKLDESQLEIIWRNVLSWPPFNWVSTNLLSASSLTSNSTFSHSPLFGPWRSLSEMSFCVWAG